MWLTADFIFQLVEWLSRTVGPVPDSDMQTPKRVQALQIYMEIKIWLFFYKFNKIFIIIFWDLETLRTWFWNANQWYPITSLLGGFFLPKNLSQKLKILLNEKI